MSILDPFDSGSYIKAYEIICFKGGNFVDFEIV